MINFKKNIIAGAKFIYVSSILFVIIGSVSYAITGSSWPKQTGDPLTAITVNELRTWGVNGATFTNGQDATANPIYHLGNIGIGTSSVSAGLLVDIEGKVGAMEYCDETGGSCNTIGSIAAAAANSIPSGAVMAFNLAACPSGWSEIAGARGRVIVGLNGADASFDVLGETGGEKTHMLTTAEIPAHTHGIQASPNSPGGSYNTLMQYIPNTAPSTWIYSDQNTGGGSAHNNLQPYITFLYCQKN